MNILEYTTPRKYMKREQIHAGNGEGGTPLAYFFGEYSSRSRVCRVSIGMATPLI